MAQKIARMKRPKNDQDYLVFCYTHLENFEEANEIFNELNKDSHKNRIYIRMSAFQQSVRQDTHVLLKESHNECFSKRKVTQDYKTIASFLDEVSDTGLFDVLPAFNTSPRVLNPTGQQIYDYLIELNDHVFELHGYDNILKEDTDECLYYKKDYPVLNQGCLLSLRRCNFDQKLRDIGVDYFHIKKKNKKRIVRTTRNKVWQLHYGKKKRATCPIPNCNKQINFDKFECGHVIPESRGGENVVENLRPICGKCNSSMKNMYWDDYVNRIS